MPTPVKVLEDLATAIVRCMEPWRLPQPLKVVVLKHISSNPRLADLRRFVMCCDAAMDGVRYSAGAYIPCLRGVRTSVLPSSHTQQSAELWAMVWMIRLAVPLQWRLLVLVSDLAVASTQLLKLRPSTWLR